MMLRYRAAAWFVRTTAPELAMGLSTHEEMLDVIDARETESGSFEVVTDDPAPEVDAETGEITGE
jgi:hypothetical protein